MSRLKKHWIKPDVPKVYNVQAPVGGYLGSQVQTGLQVELAKQEKLTISIEELLGFDIAMNLLNRPKVTCHRPRDLPQVIALEPALVKALKLSLL